MSILRMSTSPTVRKGSIFKEHLIMKHDALIVPLGKKIRLKDFDPGYTGKYQSKDEAREKLEADTGRLAEYQDVLYAQNTYALLIIFQAMDAAGKDGTIKHVMSGVNPQGTQAFSFKAPSAEELDHDRSEEHTSELQSHSDLVCRLLLEKKKK